MVSGSHHLGCLSEPRYDLETNLAGVGLGAVCCLDRKGWYRWAREDVGGTEVEVGVSMQLMRSGRGLGSFKAACELRKFNSRWYVQYVGTDPPASKLSALIGRARV